MSKIFSYLRPTTSLDACRLKAKYREAAAFWAGGTDLLLQWRDGIVKFDHCIDLSFIPDLDYIKCSRELIHIGALTKVASIETSSPINELVGILRQAASSIAAPQIRNVATIGGNLCNAAPSADLAVPLLALGAEVKLLSVSGERIVALEDFFLGVNKTAMEERELLTEVTFPVPPPATSASFLKVGRTSVDIALVNVALQLTVNKASALTDVRIALGAVAPVPIRAQLAEELLLGINIADLNEDLIEKVSSKAAGETKPITDIRASAAYRREISKVLVRRAIEDALQKLKGRAA